MIAGSEQDVAGQPELSCLLAGAYNVAAMAGLWQKPLKLSIYSPREPALPLLFPTKILMQRVLQHKSTGMFAAALIKIAKNWEQPKRPPIIEDLESGASCGGALGGRLPTTPASAHDHAGMQQRRARPRVHFM